MKRITMNSISAWRTILFAAFLTTTLFVFFATVALAQHTDSGTIPTAKLQQRFMEAGKAYDEGNMEKAISLYENLIRDGYPSKELFYNLGNAYFKSGHIGSAVLSYRRAWYYAPRDPDIQANLRFALQSAGTAMPVYSRFILPFLKLSRNEWMVFAVLFYWCSALIGAALMLARRQRYWLIRGLATCGILLLLSLAGIGIWNNLCHEPECVIVQGKQKALFAPLEGSTAHFELPEGSIVREHEKQGEWIKVASANQEGWIRASTCATVCPWQAAHIAYAGE